MENFLEYPHQSIAANINHLTNLIFICNSAIYIEFVYLLFVFYYTAFLIHCIWSKSGKLFRSTLYKIIYSRHIQRHLSASRED